MGAGARTPEELETLFEDAFVLRDSEAVTRLFAAGAVLVAGVTSREARGSQQIASLTAEMWELEHMYVADPRRILQARDTALVLGRRAINVVRRRNDGSWRYAISFLEP